ncbi:MAG TPA: two-component regulator propeller domain-containing protein [Bacteroidota bacterium]
MPNIGKNLKFLLAILSVVVSSTRAQYVVRQWNVEHGLPQSSPRCIMQTHDGYLWVGTWNGLARFDGVRMTVFNALNTPNMHPSIVTIHEDRNRRLWIGTDGGGLLEYWDGRFVNLDSADGISAKEINSIVEDSGGTLWIGTNSGVFILRENRFLQLTAPDVFQEDHATHVTPAPDGSVYLQFVSKIYQVRLSGDTLVFLGKPFFSGGYRIAVDSSGAIWYGVKGKGLVKRVGTKEYHDRRFAHVHPKEVFIPRNQQKWVMTPHGAYILDGNEVRHIQTIDGIDLSNISYVFQDREGILWVAVEGAGLLRLQERQVQTFTKEDGLETDAIMCGMEDQDGNIWIGTWLGGLAKRSPGEHRFRPVPPLTGGISIMALDQSRDGTIWVGTWAHGVYTIKDGKVRRFLGKGLTESTTIRAIEDDPRGGVWIAAVYGMVGYYNGSEQRTWDQKDGIPNHINTLLLTRDGDVWVGTDGGGIAIVSGENISILNSAKGIIDDFFHVSIEDTDGSIWLTSKRGLQRWKNGILSTVSTKLGLEDDAAQFIQDDDGHYWSGGTHGIHRIRQQDLNDAAEGRLKTLSYLTIGKADGMPVEECSGGSNELVWKTRDGALWFSTTHGAIRVDPRSVASNPVPPGVIIDQVQVEHNPIQWNQQIVMNPEETKIEFHYTGINFAAPDRIRFQYKLEGFEDDWRDVGYERFAQYTNLAPGEYTFRVKAANNAGVWNEEGASAGVIVLPPFWATWWFRGMVIVVFLSVGPLIYWRRVSGLKKEQERQRDFARRLIAEQESERQRIANELHDSLGQNLLVLKNRILVAQQEDGGRKDLGEMSDLVSQTIEEVRSVSHNLRPHQLDQLGVSKTIRALIKNLAESSHIAFAFDVDDVDDVLKGDEDIGLFRIVQESLNNIVKHSEATEVHVSLKRNPDGLLLIIGDNGKGMGSVPTGERLGEGFGLSGMKERARILGGRISFSSIARGTVIELKIPKEKKI